MSAKKILSEDELEQLNLSENGHTIDIVTLNVRTSFGVACRDANHLIHTPSISA